jgi:hypothetical protein
VAIEIHVLLYIKHKHSLDLACPNVCGHASVSDTDTYGYIELWHFKKIIIGVDVSVSYPVSMVVSVLHILVIAYILILSVTATFVTRKMKMQSNQSTKNILTETKAFFTLCEDRQIHR